MKRKSVDVEQVMEEVNRAVAAPHTLLDDFWREKKPQSPTVSFIYPPSSRSLEVNLDLVSRNWELDGEFEIGTQRRWCGGLVVAFKRTLRSMLRWYINPLVHQQRKFNMLVTRTLNDLSNNLDQISRRVEDLERALERERGGPEER